MPQKITRQMDVFYNKLNDFVENFLVGGFDPQEWEPEEFKECFVQNMPKILKPVKVYKDPAEPRKAKGAYIFFSSDPEIRKTIKTETPDASPTEMMKLIGALWSSDEYKNYNDDGEHKDKNNNMFDYSALASKYITLAEEDKKRYTQEMLSYTPNSNFVAQKPKKKSTSKSAYMFFCDTFREKAKAELVQQYSGRQLQTEVMKCLGKWWNEEYKNYVEGGECKGKDGRSFDYTERAQEFIDMAKEDKARVELINQQESDVEIEIEIEKEDVKIFEKSKVKSTKFIENCSGSPSLVNDS